MKKFFVMIAAAMAAFFKWLWNVVLDLTTFLREGDKASAFSSKRISGVCLIVAGIKLLFVGTSVFQSIINNGWYAIFVYIPSALCFVIALVLFYINGKIDIATAIDKTKELIDSAEKKS